MAKKQKLSVRAFAAITLAEVLSQHRSLTAALADNLPKVAEQDRALFQQLCYGATRWYPLLNFFSESLLTKRLKAKDTDIHALLILGIYQLREMKTPPHAAISETVNAAKLLGKTWAANLINACLRNYQRQSEPLQQKLEQSSAITAHPQWLIDTYRKDWPEHYEQILQANNQQPPMALRVNLNKTSVEEYLAQLTTKQIEASAIPDVPSAILLSTPCDVFSLPGFTEGWVSVQDGAAQLAASIMEIHPNQHILDACAAPGGKTGHILESCPENDVVAIDIEENRLLQIQQNMDRIGLSAQLICADAANIDSWWDGKQFDRILLDAPCSGSGVIRRHPDIKLLRRPEDIESLVEQQKNLLENLWSLLKPEGLLVYTTCSAFKQENEMQIAHFLQTHNDAEEVACHPAPASRREYGYQRLPGDDGMDGFYYACLKRH